MAGTNRKEGRFDASEIAGDIEVHVPVVLHSCVAATAEGLEILAQVFLESDRPEQFGDDCTAGGDIEVAGALAVRRVGGKAGVSGPDLQVR